MYYQHCFQQKSKTQPHNGYYKENQLYFSQNQHRYQLATITDKHWKDVLWFHEHVSLILQNTLHENLSLLNIPSAVTFFLLTNLLNTLCKHHFMQIRFSEMPCENTCIRTKSTRMMGINACCQIIGKSEQFLKGSFSRMQIHFFITPFSRWVYF